MKTIRELRERRGWTQVDLAHEVGVTPSTVYNWERGRTEISALKLRQLAQLFGVSMDEIVLPAPEPGKERAAA